MAHLLGIRSHLEPVCSITLGVEAVNPLEMTNAYATLAARGARRCATPLVELANRNGKAIADVSAQAAAGAGRERRRPGHVRAGGRRHAAGRARPRTSAVRPPARPAPRRTTSTRGSAATRRSSRRACGSATRRARSRWRASRAYSPVFGGTIPAAIWHDFMTVAMQGQPVEAFPDPVVRGPHGRPGRRPVSSPRRAPRRRRAALDRARPARPRPTGTGPDRPDRAEHRPHRARRGPTGTGPTGPTGGAGPTAAARRPIRLRR